MAVRLLQVLGSTVNGTLYETHIGPNVPPVIRHRVNEHT